MKCPQDTRDLVGFLLGELPRWRMFNVASHVGRCTRCMGELLSLQEVVEGLTSLERLRAPEWALAEAKRRYLARLEAPVQLRRTRVPAFAAAAVAVIALSLTLAWLIGSHLPANSPSPAVAPPRALASATPSEPRPLVAVIPQEPRFTQPECTRGHGPPGKAPAVAAKRSVAPVIAKVSLIYGRPEVRRGGKGPWKPLAVGDPVRDGDYLRTDLASRIILAKPRAQKLCLNFDTHAKITGKPSGEEAVRLDRGAFWARLRRGHEPFEVKTEAGTVKALGTEFAVEAPHPDRAKVTVIKGEAELVNRYGVVRCKSGYQASLSDTQPPAVIGGVGHGEITRYRTAWGWDIYQIAAVRKLYFDRFLRKLVGRIAYIGLDGAKTDGGLLVTMVLPDSPAEKAGIKPGDVLTELAGRPIRAREDTLIALGNLSPGQTVTAKIRVDDFEKERSVTLEAKPWMPAESDELSEVYRAACAGRLDDAKTFCQRILRDNPNSAGAHNNLGAIYEYRGDMRAAVREYLLAVRAKPREAWYHHNLGIALRQVGNLDEAARELEVVRGMARNWGEAQWELGEVYVFACRFNEALEQAQRVREVPGWSAWGDCIEGYALIMQKQFEQAIAVLERATKRDPFCWEAFRLLGNAYVSKGDVKLAAASLQRAVTLRPSSPRVYNSLGLVEFKGGNYRLAEKLVRKAISIDPGCASLYENLTAIYYQRKDWEHAKQSAQRAIELLPEAPYFYQGLGATYAAMKKWRLAADTFRLQLSFDPGNTRIFREAIKMYAKEWSPSGAKALQEEAYAQELVDPVGWRRLAELFQQHGQLKVAEQCRREARTG